MKLKFLLFSLVILSAIGGFSQKTGDVTIYSNTGKKFFVVLNGIRQNLVAETNVHISGLTQEWYKCLIMAEDKSFSIEKNIGVKKDTTVTYQITGKKSKYKMRYYSEAANGTAIVPDQVVVVYRDSEEIQGGASTGTTGGNGTGQGSGTGSRQGNGNGTGTGAHNSTTTTTTTTTNNTNGTGTSNTNTVNTNGTGQGAGTGSKNGKGNGSGGGVYNVENTTTTTGTQENGSGSIGININTNGTGVTINTNGGTTNTTSEETITTTTTVNGVTTSSEETTVITNGNGSTVITTTTTTGGGVTTSTNGQNNVNYTNGSCVTASPNDLESIKAAIKNENFSEDKLRIANQAVKDKCMTVAQIKEIALLFSFSKDQMAFIKSAYGNCMNKSDYYQLNSVFTFSSDKKELEDFINSH